MATKQPKKQAVKTKKEAKPKDFTIKLFNTSGKEVGVYELNKGIFSGEVNKAVLHQAVVMYNANKRQGTASTKTRGDVSGGGKKPYRQKGTGRARAGSTRSPLWRGGGSIFGPHPRDYSYQIPKKVKRLAFISSLNVKYNENKLIGLDALEVNEPKTKRFQSIIDALKLNGKCLFVCDTITDNVKRASRNIPNACVTNCREFNTMDVMTSDVLVMEKQALDKLTERLAA